MLRGDWDCQNQLLIFLEHRWGKPSYQTTSGLGRSLKVFQHLHCNCEDEGTTTDLFLEIGRTSTRTKRACQRLHAPYPLLFKSFDQLTLGRKERNMIDKPNRMENLRKVCPQVWFSKASMTLIAEIRKWARDRDFFLGGQPEKQRGTIENSGDFFSLWFS